MNLHELTLASEGLDEAGYLERHAWPALVFLTETARLEDTPAHDTVRPMTINELVERTRTRRMTEPIPTPGSSTSPTVQGDLKANAPQAVTPSSTVFFLEKSSRNPFGSLITVGRATNNDIVLPLRTVSKMHAYFMGSSGPAWKVTDQHSANGTFVDGFKLPGGSGANLSDNAHIAFGADAQCRFLEPKGLWKLIVTCRNHVVRPDRPG